MTGYSLSKTVLSQAGTATDKSESIVTLYPKCGAAPHWNPPQLSIEGDHQLREPAT